MTYLIAAIWIAAVLFVVRGGYRAWRRSRRRNENWLRLKPTRRQKDE
jgi:hypothetical protein